MYERFHYNLPLIKITVCCANASRIAPSHFCCAEVKGVVIAVMDRISIDACVRDAFNAQTFTAKHYVRPLYNIYGAARGDVRQIYINGNITMDNTSVRLAPARPN